MPTRPRRTYTRSVTDEDHVRFHRHIRVGAGKQPRMAPMRSGSTAAQQSGLSQDERSGANRRQSPGPDWHGFHCLHKRRINRPATSPSPPATSTVSADSIDAIRSVTAKPVPIEVADIAAVDRRDLELVLRPEPIGFREHLCRSRRIKQFDAVETTITTTRGFGRVADTQPVCRNLCETWPIRQGPVDRRQPTLAAHVAQSKSLNATAPPGMSRRPDTSIDPDREENRQ